MLFFKDGEGLVYDGLIRRMLKIYSPSLTGAYWYMGKGVFTKRIAQCEWKSIGKALGYFVEGDEKMTRKQKRRRFIRWQRVEPGRKRWLAHLIWRLREPEYP